jgi:hypothetical protein
VGRPAAEQGDLPAVVARQPGLGNVAAVNHA